MAESMQKDVASFVHNWNFSKDKKYTIRLHGVSPDEKRLVLYLATDEIIEVPIEEVLKSKIKKVR